MGDMATVVIQGPFKEYSNKVVKSFLNAPFIQEVIVSCWDEDNTDSLSSIEDSRIKLVKTQKPSNPGTDNRNLQIVSSIEGIKRSTSKVTIKSRSDQVYTDESLVLMDQYYKQTKVAGDKRIFVSGIYANLLYHPCDHIFWGETADLIHLFDIPLETNGLIDKIRVDKSILHEYYPFFVRTETYICARYCAQFEQIINKYVLQPELYLYDNSPRWNEAHHFSKNVMPKCFKSFPRTGLSMYWEGKNTEYKYSYQRKHNNQYWAEEGY